MLRARGVERGLRDERLGDLDDVLHVGERLVELHHRELGVVARAEAFVAEDAPDLEHSLHAADDESLEVQLQRDSKVQLHVQRVVVRDERACVRAAGLHVQHRGLDLDEPAAVQRAAEAGDHLVADAEVLAGLVVDDEVRVALAEAGVGVGEAVPLVGQRAHRLRQQLEAAATFTLSSPLRVVITVPCTPTQSPRSRSLHGLEGVVADHGLGDEQLHLVVAVAHGGEHELARVAQQHHAAGDGHVVVGLRAGFELAELRCAGSPR